MKNFLPSSCPLLQGFFLPFSRAKKIGWGWSGLLFLVGLFFWGQFLNWGNIPTDFHDWAEVSAPRVAFVGDAFRKGAMPLHMPDASALRNVTDRFMVLPDVMLSPQMVLLVWLDFGKFILVNTWLFYALGALSLLWWRRRLDLSAAAFSLLFLLFNFNGHILTHFSVGHVNYTGYFLFPAFFAVLVGMLIQPGSWKGVARMAALLFFMLIQGSFHQFIWCLIFIGLVGVTQRKFFLPAVKAIAFSGFLGAVRLLPPVLALGKFDNEFLGGYTSVLDVWQALTALRPPTEALSGLTMLNSLGWWEFDLYVGLLGALLIIVFGLWQWIRQLPAFLPELFLPAVIFFVLSIGRIYRPLMFLQIPLIAGERVSSRLIILPFVLILLAAVYFYQQWLGETKQKPVFAWAQIGLLLLVLHDLWQHLKLWRVNVAFEAFPHTPVNLALKVISNHSDPLYITVLWVGVGVTLVTALILGLLLWRERKNTVVPAGKA